MSTDSVNPYAPPAEVTEPLWVLSPDTEFLFNDDYVASIGTLELPQVCVISGERTGLIAKDETLTAIPKSYRTALRFVVGAVCTFFLVAFATEVGPAAEKLLIVPLIVVLTAPLIIALGIRNRHRLKLRWYLSEKVVKQMAMERRRLLKFYALVGVVLLIAAAALGVLFDASMGILVVFLGIPFHQLSRPRVLYSDGEFQGLVLVKGFKSPFIVALRRMMERYESAKRPL